MRPRWGHKKNSLPTIARPGFAGLKSQPTPNTTPTHTPAPTAPHPPRVYACPAPAPGLKYRYAGPGPGLVRQSYGPAGALIRCAEKKAVSLRLALSAAKRRSRAARPPPSRAPPPAGPGPLYNPPARPPFTTPRPRPPLPYRCTQPAGLSAGVLRAALPTARTRAGPPEAHPPGLGLGRGAV